MTQKRWPAIGSRPVPEAIIPLLNSIGEKVLQGPDSSLVRHELVDDDKGEVGVRVRFEGRYFSVGIRVASP